MDLSESIYQQFVEFEEKAAGIYLKFASHFSKDPKLGAFWLDMMLQEKQHAGLLEFCLLERLFAPAVPTAAEIQQLHTLFERLEQQADDPNMTMKDAFSIAIEMESSELDAIYCRLTTPLHSSTYLLQRKIVTSIPDHIGELLEAARRFGLSDKALDDLHRIKQRCAEHCRSPS
jgi:hypothetical protein